MTRVGKHVITLKTNVIVPLSLYLSLRFLLGQRVMVVCVKRIINSRLVKMSNIHRSSHKLMYHPSMDSLIAGLSRLPTAKFRRFHAYYCTLLIVSHNSSDWQFMTAELCILWLTLVLNYIRARTARTNSRLAVIPVIQTISRPFYRRLSICNISAAETFV